MAVLYVRPTVLNLSYAYISTNVITLLIVFASTILWDRKGLLFHPVFNLSAWKTFLLIGGYLALAKGMGDITMHTDSVMLGYLGLITENGWYKAAVKINGLILFPMALISSAVFPALAAMLKESKERFIRLWKLWYKVTIFLAGMLCSIAFANAREIVETLYPSEFQPAASALKILIVMALLVYIHNLYHHVLIIFNHQKKIFYTLFVAASVNVILNLILIPRISLYGACVATVTTHLLILLQYLRITSKDTFIRPFNSESLFILLTSIGSGIAVCLISPLLKTFGVNLLFSILCNILAFSLLFIVLQKIGIKLRILSI
jgi:O-antigen/teichoic acid export membrane protein